MALKDNPLCRTDQRCHKPIERQINGHKKEDPPPRPQLAVPRRAPKWLLEKGLRSTSKKHQAIGDLVAIAFYYLLRVGEHTTKTTKDDTRTVQFRVQDITLWKNGAKLDKTAPLETLLTADAATHTIENQKNGLKGQTIHHHATGLVDCPMRATARRIHHILANTNDHSTIISACFNNGHRRKVSARQINSAVKQGVEMTGLLNQGYTTKSVSSHSLRAGGAMAMKLNGIDRDTIRKMGRWSSDTFLMCIHEQISALSKGIASTMARDIEFHNIAGPTLQGEHIL